MMRGNRTSIKVSVGVHIITKVRELEGWKVEVGVQPLSNPQSVSNHVELGKNYTFSRGVVF